MSTTQTQYEHLAPNPKSAYRQLFLKGTRIRAWVIYCDHVAQDMTAEEIAADRDLPIEAVREAIAYCATNPPEVRGDLIREEEHTRGLGCSSPNPNSIRLLGDLVPRNGPASTIFPTRHETVPR